MRGKVKVDSRVVLMGLSLVVFFSYACYALHAPFFSTVAERKGVSPFMIGVIFGMYQLCRCFSSPLWGHFITAIGVRWLYLGGIVMAGGSVALFGVLDKGPNDISFIIMCLICRAFEGIGAAAFFTAVLAIIVDMFKDEVATAYGMLFSSAGIGLLVGPPMGGLLYAAGGYGLPFYINGIVLIIGGFLCYVFLPEAKVIEEDKEKATVFQLLKHPLTYVIGLSAFAGQFCVGFLAPTLAIHLQKFHLNELEVGGIFLISPLIGTVSSLFISRLMDKKDLVVFFTIIGNIGLTVAFLAIGPSPLLSFLPDTLWFNCVTLLAHGISNTLASCPSLKGLVLSSRLLGMPDDMRTYGVISGVNITLYSLGGLLGPIVAGTLVEIYDFPIAASVCALLALISALVAIFYSLHIRFCGNEENIKLLTNS